MHPTCLLAATRRRILLIAGATVLALTGLAGQAQAWPSKPIRLVVGFPPGGGIDAVARNLQPGLQDVLGQQVIVEYKPGAGGVLAAGELTRTAPDGYTILVANIGPFVLVPSRVPKKPYDPQKDFTCIHQTSGSGFIAAVPANHPANTLAEFIAWSKAKPEVRAKFAANGNTIMEKGPEDFTAFHTAEVNRWVPVIKAAGATLD